MKARYKQDDGTEIELEGSMDEIQAILKPSFHKHVIRMEKKPASVNGSMNQATLSAKVFGHSAQQEYDEMKEKGLTNTEIFDYIADAYRKAGCRISQKLWKNIKHLPYNKSTVEKVSVEKSPVKRQYYASTYRKALGMSLFDYVKQNKDMPMEDMILTIQGKISNHSSFVPSRAKLKNRIISYRATEKNDPDKPVIKIESETKPFSLFG